MPLGQGNGGNSDRSLFVSPTAHCWSQDTRSTRLRLQGRLLAAHQFWVVGKCGSERGVGVGGC